MNAKEFEKLITSSNAARGEVLEIYYSDGSSVEGFVQRVSYDTNPPFVNLCKSAVPRGESSNHTVHFECITKLIVKPFNQEQRVYE